MCCCAIKNHDLFWASGYRGEQQPFVAVSVLPVLLRADVPAASRHVLSESANHLTAGQRGAALSQ